MKTAINTLTSTLIILILPIVSLATVFVDTDATGNNDGSSWTDAYTDLQDALTSNSDTNIWVAEGTYIPGTQVSHSFNIQDNHVYGGFSGTETTIADRTTPLSYPTVLSGTSGGAVTSAQIVVKSSTGTAILDGFTIRDGGRSQFKHGAGIYHTGGSLILANSLLINNAAEENGGALYASSGGITITNCIFRDNGAHDGAAIRAENGTVSVTDSIFSNNIARSGGAAIHKNWGTLILTRSTFANNSCTYDGAVYLWSVNIQFDDCIFSNNISSRNGGAIELASGRGIISGSTFIGNSTPGKGGAFHPWGDNSDNFTLTNCAFIANTAGGDGGAICDDIPTGNLNINNCTFRDNQGSMGSAILKARNELHITDSVFTGNRSNNRAAIFMGSLGTIVTVHRSSFTDNQSSGPDGGAVNLWGNIAVTFSNCGFTNNTSQGSGGALTLITGDTLITNCTFTGNSAPQSGGALHWSASADKTLTVIDTVFRTNTTDTKGGAIYNRDAAIQLNHCTFEGNKAIGGGARGGAIFTEYGSTKTFTNCTFTANSANSDGAGVFMEQVERAIFDKCQLTSNQCYGAGGAIYQNNINHTLLTNSIFSGNSGGAIHSRVNTSFNISDCIFSNNFSAGWRGGAISSIGDGTLQLNDSSFINNSSKESGGAMYIATPATTTGTIANCIFAKNSVTNATESGGSIFFISRNMDISLLNCTFTSNSAPHGGAIYNAESKIYATNCIFWKNSATIDGDEIGLYYSFPLLYLTYSNIDTGKIHDPDSRMTLGAGNINIDPQFVNPENDYHLKSTGGHWTPTGWVKDNIHSPCIDTGHPGIGYSYEQDFNGGRINMGAYGNTLQASLTKKGILFQLK